MRYRVAVTMLLLLLAVLPMMELAAAPIPDPWVIMDIGPPPKGKTAKEHCKDRIDRLTDPRGYLWHVGADTELAKLPSIARLKDAHPWLEKNIRVTEEDDGRHLRLTFRAGSRAEQVAILNALLRYYLREGVADSIKIQEKALRWEENCVIELETRIESGQHPDSVESYRNGIKDLRTNRIPTRRAEIARLKQVAVIKWAK